MSEAYRNLADIIDILDEHGVPVVAVDDDGVDWNEQTAGRTEFNIRISVPVWKRVHPAHTNCGEEN